MIDELIVVVVFKYFIVCVCCKIILKMLCEVDWLLCEVGFGMCEVVEYVFIFYLYYLLLFFEFGNLEVIKCVIVEGLGISCLLCLVVEDLIELRKLVELDMFLLILCWYFYMVVSCYCVFLFSFVVLLLFCCDWVQWQVLY